MVTFERDPRNTDSQTRSTHLPPGIRGEAAPELEAVVAPELNGLREPPGPGEVPRGFRLLRALCSIPGFTIGPPGPGGVGGLFCPDDEAPG